MSIVNGSMTSFQMYDRAFPTKDDNARILIGKMHLLCSALDRLLSALKSFLGSESM